MGKNSITFLPLALLLLASRIGALTPSKSIMIQLQTVSELKFEDIPLWFIGNTCIQHETHSVDK